LLIDADVSLGEGVKIQDERLVNIFGCQIGDRTFVGPFVEITYGVTIGADCLIESHSFICDGVHLDNEVFVGHGVMFTNDLYPRTDRQVVHFQTRVGHGVSIGSNATIVGGVTIGDHAVIGAGAVVTKDVPAFAIACGNPAKITRQFTSHDELMKYIGGRQQAVPGHQP
jgi:UDP-2-acetamido-3-amino-2,3-dideoxy-glucuronate N-acetyltransferase